MILNGIPLSLFQTFLLLAHVQRYLFWGELSLKARLTAEAYGTAKSGVGIASMGVMRPDMIMPLGRGKW